MGSLSQSRRGVSRVVVLCAIVSMALIVMSGTFATAEVPVIHQQLLRESHHAESHSEPSDEELERIARMPRKTAVPAFGPSASESIGYPNRGRLRLGVRLEDSDTLMVKVGSRTSRHGTAELVSLLQYASQRVAEKFTRSVMNVGDLSRESGGWLKPHKSHQNGRDVDLGFYYMNGRKKPSTVQMFLRVNQKGAAVRGYKFDTRRNWEMVAAMLEHPSIDVQHIFVANNIQRRLLTHAKKVKSDRKLIYRARRVMSQPRRGSPHRTHFHVRIFCAEEDMPRCKDRAPFYSWHRAPVAPWLEQIADDS